MDVRYGGYGVRSAYCKLQRFKLKKEEKFKKYFGFNQNEHL
jgi:hypothetical protein